MECKIISANDSAFARHVATHQCVRLLCTNDINTEETEGARILDKCPTMLYSIYHQLVAIPADPPYIIYSSTTTRGPHQQLQQHHCRINSYQHSFFPSVNPWNQIAQSLPEPTRLPHAVLNHMDHVLTGPHHALFFLPVFTNVLFFYISFI